jgi:hypothetical protein
MACLNFCTVCRTDFASVDAFDKHRVGKHAFTFSEGLELTPPREDGRRCLDVDGMPAAGLELDQRGRWRLAAAAERLTQWHLKQAA